MLATRKHVRFVGGANAGLAYPVRIDGGLANDPSLTDPKRDLKCGKYAYWGPYAASKAGLEALAKTWAQELANTHVRVNVVNPGATRTSMRSKAFPGEDARSLPAPEDLLPLFLDLVSPACTRNGDVINFREWRDVSPVMPGSGAAVANSDV